MTAANLEHTLPAFNPIEPAWADVLAGAVGRAVDPRALSVMVGRVSARCQGEEVQLAARDGLAARTLFWFSRDLPKFARAITELDLAGALPHRPLRVLDLGAGLGASSLGVARALAAIGHPGLGAVTAVDLDPDALVILKRIAEGAADAQLLPPLPEIETVADDVTRPGGALDVDARYDLVLWGLSLVEVTRGAGDEVARGEAMAKLLRRALARVADDGALVVVEPATMREARALHRAREALRGDDGVTVFAPCLHAGVCPMLRNDRDWCHEDLPLALPPWLVPIARGAGLRVEGLTFSYLVLRRDGRSLRDVVRGPALVPLRVVSQPLVSKGKTEVAVCGPMPTQTGARAMELDRSAKRTVHERMRDLPRGAVLAVNPDAVAAVDGERPLRIAPDDWTRVPGHDVTR